MMPRILLCLLLSFVSQSAAAQSQPEARLAAAFDAAVEAETALSQFAEETSACPLDDTACGVLSLRQLRAAGLRGGAATGAGLGAAEAAEAGAPAPSGETAGAPEGPVPEEGRASEGVALAGAVLEATAKGAVPGDGPKAEAEAEEEGQAVPGGWGEPAAWAAAHPLPPQEEAPDEGTKDVYGGLLNASALMGSGGRHHHFVKILFHQTSKKAARLILKYGFKPGREGWCGGGIYFATSAGATSKKAIGPDSQKGVVLAVMVDVGRVKHLGPACSSHWLGWSLRAEPFDSVCFNPGDGTEYVVYSKHRILSAWRHR